MKLASTTKSVLVVGGKETWIHAPCPLAGGGLRQEPLGAPAALRVSEDEDGLLDSKRTLG